MPEDQPDPETTPGEPPTPEENARQEAERAERRLAEDLAIRGEVIPEGTAELPPGATHDVLEEREGVPTKVRRRRFSSS